MSNISPTDRSQAKQPPCVVFDPDKTGKHCVFADPGVAQQGRASSQIQQHDGHRAHAGVVRHTECGRTKQECPLKTSTADYQPPEQTGEKSMSNINDERPNHESAVRNPYLEHPSEQMIAERREFISNALHIVHFGDCYRVLQIPGDDDEPFFFWRGEYESETAATVFRDDVIRSYASGTLRYAHCTSGDNEFYNTVGRVLDIIENNEHDTRMLAFKIASADPWRSQPETQFDPDEFPF